MIRKICLLVLLLCPSFLFSQVDAGNADTVQLGLNSRYYCAQDNDTLDVFLARVRRSGTFVEVPFRRVLRKKRTRRRYFQDRKETLISEGADSTSINRVQNRINRLNSLISDIRSCKNGEIFSDGSVVETACSVVGASGTRKLARIINGQSCSIGDSPVVELQMLDSGGNILFSCSGTAISKRAVLSAAHCIDASVASVRVKTGSGNYISNSFSAHPSFNTVGFLETNDIAVILLSNDLPTRTVNLLRANDLTAGEKAVISGYGLDETGSSGGFQAGFMTLGSGASNSISASYDGSQSNTCSGDSGGPFLVKRSGEWVIAGVTSNGVIANCGVGDVSYFANVTKSDNLSFIDGLVPGLP